jgi:TP901 family phage tail tape measure protein
MSRFILTAQLQLQAPNNVSQVVQQIQNQLNGVNVNVNVQNAGKAQKQIQQVAQATNQAATAAERMGKAFALSVRRFAAFSIATRAVGLFTSTLSSAVQSAIDFERELIKVSQVTGKTLTELRGLTKQITQLSTGFGVASSDLLQVSTILSQAGLSAEDTAVALRTLAKAALAPNFDSITETAEGAIAVLAQFQQGVGALEAQLGSINAVAGAFAVEASDLIDVIRRTGGVFKASGGSLNELLALFTSVRATTRESAESIGTGLRTIFTRIQRPKTIEFLKQFGVELVDLNGKFVGPYEAIRRLSEALAGLGEGDLTFIRIAEELGGFRQIGKVLPLLQQFSTAQSALNVAMRAGDSLTKDAASAQAALAIRIMKVKEEFLALIRSITETPTFQIMANTALNLASAMIKIADAVKPLLPMLAALAAIRLTSGIGGFLGGMMKGASSGRAYNKGGKVLGFARGGLVPGTGNGDTVPAMLAPGEFVIRKSSVNKMGAGTLAAMNENRYATGGIVVDPSKIGAFFLRPEKGADRNPIKISGVGSIKNPAALAQLGMSPKASEARKQAIDNMSVDRQAKLFGFTRTKSTRKINSDSLFDSRGNLLQSTSKAKELFRNANYSVEDTKNLDINRIQSKLDRGITKGKLSIGSQSVPMSGFISGYFPGMNDLQNSNIAKIIADNTRKGLYNTILKSVDPVISSLNNPAISINTSQARRGAKRIANDPNAQATTQGFAFEGLIQSITGAKLAGNQANFDFPHVKAASSSLKNMFTDSTGEGLDSLIKADAKRSNTTDAIDSIKNKIANDINRGKFEGVNFVKKFFGGTIQKFADGGGVGNELPKRSMSFDEDSLIAAAKQRNITVEKLKDMLDQRQSTGWRDFIMSDSEIKKMNLLPKRISSPLLDAVEAAKFERQDRIDEAVKKKTGKSIGDYEGRSREKKIVDATIKRRRFATGGGVGTDTVPALLTPGEFVVNRSSAQRIGYGNLNRMNKVGKYAKGGIVQRFAKGSSGTGAKPSGDMPVDKAVMPYLGAMDKAMLNITGAMDKFTAGLTGRLMLSLDSFGSTLIGAESLSKQYTNNIAYLNKIVPTFSTALQNNSTVNKRNLPAQQYLADAIAYNVKKLQESGASHSQIQAKVQEYISALDRNTLDVAGPSKPTSPTGGNKTAVASMATGAIVQPAVGAVAGGAGKSTFASNQTISSLESFAPGLTKSLNKMAQSANMSAQQQEELAVTIEYVSKNMQQAGKPVADVSASFQRLKARVDARTSDYEKAKVPLAPMSDARMLETAQANSRAALKGAVGGFAQTDDGKLKSTAAVAFETGQSRSDLQKARKQALQDAGFVKGSNRTTALTTKVPEATLVSDETKEAKTSRILQQARGQSSQAGTAAALAAASTKAAAADAAEAAASKAAENADKAEAAASRGAGGGKGKGKGKGDDPGGMLANNKMMAVSMGASMLQAFLPAVDESSSAMLKMTHSMLGLVTTIASVGFALEGFGVKLTMSNMGSFFGGKAGGGVANFVKNKAMSSGMLSSNMSNLLGKISGGFTNLLGPLVAAGATFFILKQAGDSLVESFFGYEEKLKKAKEIGDATNARKIAMEQQTAKKGVNVAAGGAAGAVLGGLLLGPIGAAIGGIIGAGLAEALSDTAEYAGDVAAAQAQQVAVQKSLTKASEDATKAMEDFEKGNISATDVLKSTAAATAAIEQSRAYNKKLEASGDANRDSAVTAGLRNVITLGGLLGESAGQKEQRITSEQKKMKDETDKAEKEAIRIASPGMNALSKQLAMTGGSFDDLMAKIKETDPNLFNILIRQGTNDLKRSFENIAKEVERTKKSIEAMNLGLRNATATATAASSTLTRFSANLEVGGSSFVNDIAFLQDALSSAAQAMNPNEIKTAVGNVSKMLREFGTSDEYVKKFEGNMAAFTQAQMNYGKVFESIRQSMMASGKVFSADELKKKFGEGLANSLGPEVSKEAKENLQNVINGIELSPDEVAKVMAGDLSVFGDKLSEAQKKMLEDIQKIAQERAKAEQIIIDLTKKRIDAERTYTEAQRESIDLAMEGREVQAKYGGAAVSYEEKRGAIIGKANASNASTGLGPMRTGSIGELRQRNAQIRQQYADIEMRRTQEGGMSGKSGVVADEKQKDLQKAQKDQVQTIRDLIKLEEDQLRIIGEKNKLEKDSMESLIKGDVESFFKQQAAVGATAAIATGDERLMNLYGAEALGTAYQDLQRQKDAGVQDVYGQNLGGPGGLLERAGGAALSARGVSDPGAARVLAGTTAEEEASKARLRELGGMLGETGELGAEMASMQVETASINVANAEIKYANTLEAGNQVAAQGRANGGLIYANRGIFVPRGTDTVPAMLTPGEFVVNRGAVQRGNNLQILQAMNSGSASVSNNGGSGAAMMARGGIVKYFDDGGNVTGEGQSSGGSMFENMSRFVNALTNFGTELSKNITALANLKISFSVEPTSVNINLNDTGGIMAFLKEKYIDDVVIPRVKAKLESAGDGKFKNSGGVLNTAPPP